jgi:hypothetical protein
MNTAKAKIGAEATLAAVLAPLVLLSLRMIKSVTGFIFSAIGAGFLIGLVSYLTVKAKTAGASR